jgi:hypothetical protein
MAGLTGFSIRTQEDFYNHWLLYNLISLYLK